MNPYMKPFCKQNPIFKQECPYCKKTLEFISFEFFNKDIYETKCGSCNNDVYFDAKVIADSIEAKLREMGISLS